MADFVIILERQEIAVPRKSLRYSFRALAVYDLGPAPIRDNSGAMVVARPSSEIPATALAYLTPAEAAAIDAGAFGWELFHQVDQLPGETLAQLVERVRTVLFPAAKVSWIAREQNARVQLGLRLIP